MRLAVDDRSCIRARLVLSLALDGETASSHEALAAARHLCGCRACARFAAEVTAFTHELRSGWFEPVAARRELHHSHEGGRS